MKTLSFARLTGTFGALALLMTVHGTLRADDAGVVRLGKSRQTTPTAAAAETGVVVLRGQSSDLRSRNSETSEALNRLLTGQWRQSLPGGIQQVSGSCAPVNGDACDGCDINASNDDRRSRRDRGRGGDLKCPYQEYMNAHETPIDGTPCPYGYPGPGCPVCTAGALCHEGCMANYLQGQAALHRAHQLNASAGFNAYLKCKFGYFIPDGCGGGGCAPFGCYSIVYPADPASMQYSDARDGMIYAAQGYGGPVSVPLAPNVRHTYNYGWGVPSSRLTPISHQSSVR